MFDRRLYVPLAVFVAGLLAVIPPILCGHPPNVTQRTMKVTPGPKIIQTTPIPSTFPPVTSTEPASKETSKKPEHSTKAPRHHHQSPRITFEREDSVEDSSPYVDSGSDDWDYIEDLFESSSELKRLLQEELERHRQEDLRARMPTSLPPTTAATTHNGAGHAHGRNAHAHAHPHPHPHPRAYAPPPRVMPAQSFSLMQFCREAAAEDAEPFRVSDGSFHPSYEEVPGVGVYRLHARPRSWEEARKTCEREGAQLAVPNSRTEALALMDIHNRCPRLLPTHFNDYQYLGVHDLYSEGDWETVVGDPLNETGYVVWGRNQPDNAHHHGENCLSMNRNGFFNDVPCWTELPFICEHP
ncbi:hypothetical protein R5R35_005176 [Gryllus longicercus]